ncbi:hypothetical protein K3728_08525 [Rhodobacteraceae bacterium M385]|nr:hypothetical protein K3728_08525 [Rhodobacteraceae bacterium M385]
MSRTSAPSRLQCHLRSFSHNEEGAAAVIVALLLTVLLAFVAFGTDIAVVYRDQSQLQAHSDLTALGVAADLDEADDRLVQMLDGNALADEDFVDWQFGRYLRNPAIAREDRFQPRAQGDPDVNAVTVRLRTDAPLTFAQLFYDGDSVPLNSVATASRTGAARFTLGSRFLGFDPDALSGLLTGLLGSQITLNVGDQLALDSEDINVADFLDALSNRMGFDPLNPADVLTMRPSLADFVRTMQDMLPAGVSGRLAQFTVLPVSLEAGIGDIIASDQDARDLGLTLTAFLGETEVSALDLLIAAAEAVDGTNTADLDIGVAVPGILDVDASQSFPDSPADSGWLAIGEEGTTLSTSAAELDVDVEVEPSILGGLVSGVAATRLHLPLHVDVAGATATLTELNCTTTDPNDVIARFSTAHNPLTPSDGVSVAALYLGERTYDPVTSSWVNDYADFLDIRVSLLLVSVDLTLQIRASATVGQSQVEEVSFTENDMINGTNMRTFGSGDLLATAISDLLAADNTEIRIKPSDGGLLTSAVNGIVGTLISVLPAQLLAALASPLDSVLDAVLDAVGLNLGEGELTLTGHHCERVQLVQ